MLPLGKEDTTDAGSGDIDSAKHPHLVGCACSLFVVVDCGDVVVEGGEHLVLPVMIVLPIVKVVGVGLDEHSCLLQVNPHDWMFPLSMKDITHPGSGSIDSTNHICLVKCKCSLSVAGDCSHVVIEGGEHFLALPVVHVVGKVGLDEHSCLLQVTVGEVASWFFGCECSPSVVRGCGNVVIESGEHSVLPVMKVVGNIGMDKHSCLLQVKPHDWMLSLGKEDTTHFGSGGVDDAKHTCLVECECFFLIAGDCSNVVIVGG